MVRPAGFEPIPGGDTQATDRQHSSPQVPTGQGDTCSEVAALQQPGNEPSTQVSQNNVKTSGTCSDHCEAPGLLPDLRELALLWPVLPETDRAAVVALARKLAGGRP